MKANVTFNKSGSGSVSGRVVLPAEFLRQLGLTNYDREVEINLKDNQIIIEKVERKMELKKVSYEVMEKFILDNMDNNTYNVKKVLNDEVGSLESDCEMTFEMHGYKFKIVRHTEVLNEDTDDEEIVDTYDVESLKMNKFYETNNEKEMKKIVKKETGFNLNQIVIRACSPDWIDYEVYKNYDNDTRLGIAPIKVGRLEL